MKKIFKVIIFTLVSTSTLYASTSNEEQLSKIKSVIDKYGIDLYMEYIFEKENEGLPLKKDYIDTITSIYYLKSTKTRTYKHILSKKWENAISTSAKKEQVSYSFIKDIFAEEAQKNSVNATCSVKLSRLYLNYGVKIMHIYSKSDGTFLFSTEVRKKDCFK